MQLCVKCGVTPVQERDRYCAYCGFKLRDLGLDLNPKFVMAGDEEDADGEGKDVAVLVTNTGQFGSRVRLLPPEEPWVSVAEERGPEPVVLAAGGVETFRVRVRPGAGLAGAGRARLGVAGEDGVPGEFIDYWVELPIYPAPKVALAWATPDAAVWVDEDPGPALAATVEVRSSAGTRVKQAHSPATWARVELDPLDAGRLLVHVERDAFRAEFAAEARSEVELELTLVTEAPAAEIPALLRLPVKWPAELRVFAEGANEPGGVQQYQLQGGRVHVVSFNLHNVGGRAATVTGIELETESESDRVHLLDPRPSAAAPLEVPGGAWLGGQLAVDLRGLGAGATLSAEVFPRFADGKRVPGCRLEIEVEERKNFEGAVALDFGTSYSCMAAWAMDDTSPTNDILRGGFRSALARSARAWGPTLASSILYNSRAADFRIGEIGREIIDPSNRDTWAIPVFSAKRQMGTGRSLSVEFNRERVLGTLDVDVVCADIVGALLEDAEEALGGRVTQCALTHPVRFSPRQLAALSRILEERGVAVGKMLPEPVAAAVAYASRNPPGPEHPEGYNLLVFDIGGGTTDIAVLHVHDVLTSDLSRTIRPALRAVGGLRWAGGDDITWLILRRYLVGEQAARVDDQGLAEWLGCTPEEIGRLRELLSASRVGRSVLDDRMVFSVFARVEEQKRVPGSGELVKGEDDLNAFVDQFLDDYGVLKLARETLRDACLEQPDLVLMVGSSWQIGHLRRRVADAFGGARMVVLEDGRELWKEVVALGMCIAERIENYASGVEIDLSAIPTLATARIGYAGLDPRTNTGIFRTVIPANKRVGDDDWSLVEGISLSRTKRIRVLENTGGTDELARDVGGVRIRNPEIDVVGTVSLDPYLPKEVTDEVLRRGRLLMRLNDRHQVEIRVEAPVTGSPWHVAVDRPEPA